MPGTRTVTERPPLGTEGWDCAWYHLPKPEPGFGTGHTGYSSDVRRGPHSSANTAPKCPHTAERAGQLLAGSAIFSWLKHSCGCGHTNGPSQHLTKLKVPFAKETRICHPFSLDTKKYTKLHSHIT